MIITIGIGSPFSSDDVGGATNHDSKWQKILITLSFTKQFFYCLDLRLFSPANLRSLRHLSCNPFRENELWSKIFQCQVEFS